MSIKSDGEVRLKIQNRGGWSVWIWLCSIPQDIKGKSFTFIGVDKKGHWGYRDEVAIEMDEDLSFSEKIVMDWVQG